MLQRRKRERRRVGERRREKEFNKTRQKIKLNAALNQLWPKFITKINSLSRLSEGSGYRGDKPGGEGCGAGNEAQTRSDKKCIINDVVLFCEAEKLRYNL